MASDIKELIRTGCEENKIWISDDQLLKLSAYTEAILKINENLNLTAIRDPQEFVTRNIIDSLMIKSDIPWSGASVADVGTGGGFPGIPLAACLEADQFTLIDATGKKLKAVEEAAREAGIDNVTFVNARAEELGKNPAYRGKFDYVVTRAVASLRILSELCLPLLRVGGELIALKGAKYQEEIDEAEPSIKILGGGVPRVIKREILHSDRLHVIIIVGKTEETPKKYPRAFGQIKNKPLS